MKYLVTMLVLLVGLEARAGGEVQPRGARSVGLGNSSVMHQGIWSAFNNQAGLMSVKGVQAGGYYRNLFFVDGLSDQGLVVAYGTEKHAFALDISSFGVEQFSERKLGLAYAMGLGEKLDMGVQLNYHATRVGTDGTSKKNSLTAEIGLLAHVNDRLDIGFKLFNPSQTLLSEYEDERIPTILSLGGSYEFNDKVSLVSEVTKDLEMDAIVRAGVEYLLVPTVFLRAGVSTEPTLSSFGAGFILGQLDIDVAASYHHTLGYSTQISLNYRFSGDDPQ